MSTGFKPRAPTGQSAPSRFYGKQRADNLALGTCDVSIPRGHRTGELETPFLRVFENPEEHVVLLSVTPQGWNRYVADLKSRIERSTERSALVFIHGFNVTFADAARRTAQLAYDLSFQGAPILYSWPSQGDATPAAYLSDEAAIEASIPHLREFLARIADESGARQVHLIAHSMGNRALTRALDELARDSRPKMFSEVVLAAPDIDADVFRQLARRFPATAGRVTLYGSSNDRAISFSRKVHGYPRAGEGGKDLVVVTGVESIDASAVDTSLLGHSYYGSHRSVLADLYHLLMGEPPSKRFDLQAVGTGGLPYWRFRP